MQKLRGAALALSLTLALAACDKQPASLAGQTQDFFVKGVVKELEPDGKTILIRHEAISNYMAAMTMPFEVNDTNLLRGLQAGDEIKFHLVVAPDRGWIDHITLLRSNAPSDNAAAPPGFHFLPALPPLDEGDELPEYHFTNELSQPVSLSQFKGQTLALTFFFTSCPYPDFCPRMTGNFAAAQKELETKTNTRPWHLFSISFDPTNDTPARLRSYAMTAHYDPNHWSFLTGDGKEIEELADQLGEQYWRDGAGLSHNLRTVVVDPRGRIRKILIGNKWTAAQLVEEMLQAGMPEKEKAK
ncbi:MAG: SCO family protein [Limisphaerales bacterium]